MDGPQHHIEWTIWKVVGTATLAILPELGALIIWGVHVETRFADNAKDIAHNAVLVERAKVQLLDRIHEDEKRIEELERSLRNK